VKGVSNEKKLSLKTLTLPQLGEQNNWFWDEVNASGLTSLMNNGYKSITHGFVCALSERWHEETSNFYLLVGEMTITLDDVACLLGIPITRRLLPDEELTREEGIQMMQVDLHFTEEAAAKEVARQGAAHVNFGKLKRWYEELLNRCHQLLEPDTEEVYEEQGQVRLACIKAFLLLLLCWTLFALQDMDELGNWTWGAMGHVFLYEQLSLTSDSFVAPCRGYMSMLVVIIVFLFFYLLDHKCIVVCIIFVLI